MQTVDTISVDFKKTYLNNENKYATYTVTDMSKDDSYTVEIQVESVISLTVEHDFVKKSANNLEYTLKLGGESLGDAIVLTKEE